MNSEKWTVQDYKAFRIRADGRVVEDNIQRPAALPATHEITVNRKMLGPIVGKIVTSGRITIAASEAEPGKSYSWVYEDGSGRQCRWLGTVPRIEGDQATFDLPDNDGTWANVEVARRNAAK